MKVDTGRSRWPFAVAWLVLWAGCGGSMGYAPTELVEPERESPVELESDQIAGFELLREVLARPETDCSAACDLSDAICGLRGRICGISRRHRDDEATRGRCRDSSERCDRARERVAESCSCAEP